MANADMNRLMDNARIRLPGALDAGIKLELFSVLNEFFQESNIWYEDIDFAVTPTAYTYLESPSSYTYDIEPADQGVINRLMGVVSITGTLQSAVMPIPGSIILGHSPNQADTYRARVSKTITDPVTRDGYPLFPDWLLNKYGNDILDGVLGRMMSQLAKPYSNVNLAGVHLKLFKQAVNKARTEATHQNLYRGQRWSFPQTFARNRRL